MVGKLRKTTARALRGRGRATSSEKLAGGEEESPTIALAVRRDPIPDLAPPPKGMLHVVLVEGVPVDYGGRTASILAKCRSLAARGGVPSVILVRHHAPHLARVVASMRDRGHLTDAITVMSLQQAYPDATSPGTPDQRSVETPDLLEEHGWLRSARAEGVEMGRYDDGLLAARRRFRDGLLQHEDQFDAVRELVRRDEFDAEGRRTWTTLWDGTHRSPRQQVGYRRNGAPMFSLAALPPSKPKGWVRENGATTFDDAGRPEAEHTSVAPVLHRALDALIDGRPTVLSVEARVLDRETLSYERPHVGACYVLHSSHLESPGTDLAAIRPSYARALGTNGKGAPSVVFLTDTQRAEAEAQLGEQRHFEVIPHAAPAAETSEDVDRDPDLTIMMGRLVDEKRVEDGVRAFSAVVDAHPAARLEIFGDGPRKGALNRLVHRLGLQDSVRLAGFTTDPRREFRRASLCLLTSKYEGAPMTLVEALTHGCPVVSYDIRYGPADIIEHGVNGFLVPAGDRDALAERALSVLTDPALAARLREGCARAEQRFGEDAFVARWFDLFHRLLAGRTTPPTEETSL